MSALQSVRDLLFAHGSDVLIEGVAGTGRRRRLLDATEVFVLSFAAAILLGTVVLMLPGATAGGDIALIDALFTATSAVCVTGLTVVDTGTYFTRTGQVLVLCMIQLGGLGIMTFSVILLLLSRRRVSLRNRMLLRDVFVPGAAGEVYPVVRRLFLLTFSIEGLGVLLLWLAFPDHAFFPALFHAVSAFCNAGFSLFPNNLTPFKYSVSVNLIICALIVLGGLGFFTMVELVRRVRRGATYRLSLHTTLVVIATTALIVAGGVGFGIFESRNLLKTEGLPASFLISLFQSITARTAGFNTVDFARLTNATLYMIILLMFAGASPGSTGGGIKTTTVGVLLALAKSRLLGQESVSTLRRTIPDNTVDRALSVLVLAFTLVTFAVLVLSFVELGGTPYGESDIRFLDIFFEVVSGFGTVGLSTGITARLSAFGKLILVLVMFVGRVGPLTMAIAVGRRRPKGKYRYAEESVMVG